MTPSVQTQFTNDLIKLLKEMAIITHTAYHLGAIRQLLLAVRPAD